MAAAPLHQALQDDAAEARTARYLESIRGEPLLLAAFLRAMPKGGDLHNHPSGAEYAESYIAYAAEDGLCVLHLTLTLTAPPCDSAAGSVPASQGLTVALRQRAR